VLDDSFRLGLCLAALDRQTYPKEATRILVIDNGSAENVLNVTRRFLHVEYARQPIRGPAAARNKGLALSRGDIIAFTDSDCLPAPDWLERGVARVKSCPHCGLVGGRIDMFFRDSRRPTAAELYDSANYFRQKYHIETNHYAATANAFTRRSVFAEIGGFREEFKEAAYEDFEWGNRIFAKGFTLLYAEDAVVAHPARRTIAEVCRGIARVQNGARLMSDLRGQAEAPLPIRAARKIFMSGVRAPLWLGSGIVREKRLYPLWAKPGIGLVVLGVHAICLCLRFRSILGNYLGHGQGRPSVPSGPVPARPKR